MASDIIDCIVRPTAEEFKSFGSFLEENAQKIREKGLIKVIPPEGWQTPIFNVEENKQLLISSPRRQNFKKLGDYFQLTPKFSKGQISLENFINDLEKDYHPLAESSSQNDHAVWAGLEFTEAVYSVDNSFSLFAPSVKEWNLNNLDDTMNKAMRQAGRSIPGVTSPHVFVGSRRSQFLLHKEDEDLFSVAYLHYGAPKQWYGVPAVHQNLMDTTISSWCKKFQCTAPERHKFVTVDPSSLPKTISVTKMKQDVGEFIITGGGCYHWGFNWGFNVSESVNCAPLQYIDQPDPRPCSCTKSKMDIRATMLDFKRVNDQLESQNVLDPYAAAQSSGYDNRKDSTSFDEGPRELTPKSPTEESTKQHVNQNVNIFKSRRIKELNEKRHSRVVFDVQPDVFRYSDDDEHEDDNHQKTQEKSNMNLDKSVISEISEIERAPEKNIVNRGGRKRDPKKEETPNCRPSRMCPLCRRVTDRNANLDRHLKSNCHSILNDKKRKKYVQEAEHRVRAGLREAHWSHLPTAFREALKDPATHKQFQFFLDEVGVTVNEPLTDNEEDEVDESTLFEPKSKRRRTESESSTSGDEAVVADETHAKSVKKKMQELEYPLLAEETTLLKEVIRIQEFENRKDLLAKMLCPVRRVLGFVQMKYPDPHGWLLLQQHDRIREYFDIVSKILEPASLKTYCDHLLKVYSITLKHCTQSDGWPENADKNNHLKQSIESVKSKLELFNELLMKKKDHTLMQKKIDFGENIPDVTQWEAYLSDTNVISDFDRSLKALQNASVESIRSLQRNPRSSPLREQFNYVVQYLAARRFFLGCRPGELMNLTTAEFDAAKLRRGMFQINVKEHKTKAEQAIVAIPEHEMEQYRQYRAILNRFQPPPTLFFPFFSPTKGFTMHTNLSYGMNKWLQKHNKEKFTHTKLRHVLETNANLGADESIATTVAKALNHRRSTAQKYYNCPTSEQASVRIKAVTKVKAEGHVRAVLNQTPPAFDVNIFRGPLDKPNFDKWCMSVEKEFVPPASEGLYEAYNSAWLEQGIPQLEKRCVDDLKDRKTTLKSIVCVLNKIPAYLRYKHDIIQKCKDALPPSNEV